MKRSEELRQAESDVHESRARLEGSMGLLRDRLLHDIDQADRVFREVSDFVSECAREPATAWALVFLTGWTLGAALNGKRARFRVRPARESDPGSPSG